LKEERRRRVFENRVFRIIFGPKRDEVTGVYRKLNNEERVIQSRIMRCAGHVARMGRGEACTGFWWGNLRERDQWGGPGIGGRIILRWIFKK
jgi:hypothetical protein